MGNKTTFSAYLKRVVVRLFFCLSHLYLHFFPVCQSGNHRQVGQLVTNKNGNSYCWHKDCISANFKDVEDCNHNLEPAFASGGKCYERCSGCGAHQV